MKLCLLVILLALAVLLPTVALAGDPMGDVFANHKDFPCVKALPAFVGARVPELDAFAKEKGLDANQTQCFFYVSRFERDEIARLTFYKRALTGFDQAALHYLDINATTYALGGQPAYPFLRGDGQRPVSNRWRRYPTEFLMFPE